MTVRVLTGDCLDVLRGMEDASVDSVVTDPPYGWKFMGRKWDYEIPSVELWAEVLRVLKPGGHLLSFCGTRTQHRMAVNIEDAGFEIRDMLGWLYGSGFPKSLDVSKAIDKAAGAEREVVGVKPGHEDFANRRTKGHLQTDNHNEGWQRPWKERDDAGRYHMATAPATDAARQWQGWGTALKPSLEPVTLARKPLAEKTVAAQVLATGTGALNVDGCRVEAGSNDDSRRVRHNNKTIGGNGKYGGGVAFDTGGSESGRWPANLLHDGSEEVLGLFPVTASGSAGPEGHKRKQSLGYESGVNYADRSENAGNLYGDSGSAARFFPRFKYCPKASKADRGEGNTHSTVKPTELMRWLCRLVTPPGGVVLDPFAGSGTTGIAAAREGFNAILIEREEAYAEIARSRIAKDGGLFAEVAAE